MLRVKVFWHKDVGKWSTSETGEKNGAFKGKTKKKESNPAKAKLGPMMTL